MKHIATMQNSQSGRSSNPKPASGGLATRVVDFNLASRMHTAVFTLDGYVRPEKQQVKQPPLECFETSRASCSHMLFVPGSQNDTLVAETRQLVHVTSRLQNQETAGSAPISSWHQRRQRQVVSASVPGSGGN